MKQENCRTHDRAASPVIGVIMMVAVTVILSATIATFVLGLGSELDEGAPGVNFGTDYNGEELTITHQNGESIPESQLQITGHNDENNSWAAHSTGPDTVSAGISATVAADQDDTVRVVWQSPEGDTSAVLMTWGN